MGSLIKDIEQKRLILFGNYFNKFPFVFLQCVRFKEVLILNPSYQLIPFTSNYKLNFKHTKDTILNDAIHDSLFEANDVICLSEGYNNCLASSHNHAKVVKNNWIFIAIHKDASSIPDSYFIRLSPTQFFVSVFQPPLNLDDFFQQILNNKNLQSEFSSFCRLHDNKKVIDWYCDLLNKDKIPALIQKITRFSNCDDFYQKNPIQHLLLTDQDLTLIKTLSKTSTKFLHFMQRATLQSITQSNANESFWNQILIQKSNISPSLPLNLDEKILPFLPHTWGMPFKLSKRMCTRLALSGLYYFQKISFDKEMYEICQKHLQTVRKFDFRGLSLTNFEHVSQHLNIIGTPRYQMIINKYGFMANINHPVFSEKTGQKTYPFPAELPPYNESKQWILNPKSKELPTCIQQLIFTGDLTLESSIQFRKEMQKIIKTGKGYTVPCAGTCTNLVVFNSATKMCNSVDCDKYMCSSCFKRNNWLSSYCPGKRLFSSLDSSKCPFCHKGGPPKMFMIPSVDPSVLSDSLKEVWWCKICLKAVVVNSVDLKSNLFSMKIDSHTKQYFICDDQECQSHRHYTTCPYCHYAITKYEGCNDMKCKCGNSFCFSCIRPVSVCFLHQGYPCSASYNNHHASILNKS